MSARFSREAAQLLVNYSQANKLAAIDDSIAKLRGMGTEVYINTLAEKEMFRDAAQGPVKTYIESQVGAELVAAYLDAVEIAKARVYGD